MIILAILRWLLSDDRHDNTIDDDTSRVNEYMDDYLRGRR